MCGNEGRKTAQDGTGQEGISVMGNEKKILKDKMEDCFSGLLERNVCEKQTSIEEQEETSFIE